MRVQCAGGPAIKAVRAAAGHRTRPDTGSEHHDVPLQRPPASLPEPPPSSSEPNPAVRVPGRGPAPVRSAGPPDFLRPGRYRGPPPAQPGARFFPSGFGTEHGTAGPERYRLSGLWVPEVRSQGHPGPVHPDW